MGAMWECLICGAKFKTAWKLQKHRKKAHGQ